MDADIKQQFATVRAEIQASQMALRQDLRQAVRDEGTATRRHSDLVGKSLRDDIRLIAEGLIALDAKVEAMRDSG